MKTLVVIRTKSNPSNNPAPVSALAGKINADIALSIYDDQADWTTEIEKVHFYRGGKWSGLYDFFACHPEDLENYDLFWFPDDDIETDAPTVNRFLEIVKRQRFELAQPALSPDSYYSSPIVLAHDRFEFRRTNFVELMMPVMDRTMLKRLLPVFEERHAALGIDLMWHQLASYPDRNVAIVDGAPMGHRRQRNTHLKNRMKDLSVDIQVEKRETMSAFGIREPWQVVRSARTKDGLDLSRSVRLLAALVNDQFRNQGRLELQRMSYLEWAGMVVGQMICRPDAPAFDRSKWKG